jgi:soluble lytic murein transglycosylase
LGRFALIGFAAGLLSTTALAGPLDFEVRQAGIEKPLPGSARPYALAKKALDRGRPADALKALSQSKFDLLKDREALLRGDALMALGQKKAAKKAYLEAIEHAQLERIALLAARGLVNVLGELGEHTLQLEYVDALLDIRRIARKPDLMWTRAQVLAKTGKKQEAAEQAWQLLLDFPTASAARGADRLLADLSKDGVKVPTTSNRLELSRIRTLIRSRAFTQAETAMKKLERAAPSLLPRIDRLRAEMFERQRRRDDEREVLERLVKAGLDASDGPEILFRLGRIGMAKDEDAVAIKWFDELGEKFPKSRDAAAGEYLAGWIPYNAGNYAESTRRMLRFAEKYPKNRRRTEALWYAGWSAYLGQDEGKSRRAFTQLMEEHPTSTLVPHARYWLGRIHHKNKQIEEAKAEYREVLRSKPLSYYGFWSMARLEELGEVTVLDPPPAKPKRATLAHVVQMLGPSRPIGVDRAVALHREKLNREVLQELTAVDDALDDVKNTRGRTMIADLLHTLGAHHLAFRIGMRIANGGGDLETGEPYAWRAWRHAYPRAFESYVDVASKQHEVEEDLILSIMRTESHFRPYVRSHAGARGLMQLLPTTAKRIGKRDKRARVHSTRYKNPKSNVWLGTWYLRQLLERYNGQLPAAIGAYNAGPGAMDSWLESFSGMPLDEFVERVPYRETRRYIRRVLETYMVYRRLDGKPMPTLISKLSKNAPPNGAVSF